jgi:hypothetical protein
MLFKSQFELDFAQRRFWYEQKLGRSVTKKDWTNTEEICNQKGINLNKENIELMATIHKQTPKYFRNKEAFSAIAEILKKQTPQTLTGQELVTVVIELCQKRNEIIPSQKTIYRWFSKTEIGGYRANHKIYTKKDACVVLINALLYKTKNKKIN